MAFCTGKWSQTDSKGMDLMLLRLRLLTGTLIGSVLLLVMLVLLILLVLFHHRY